MANNMVEDKFHTGSSFLLVMETEDEKHYTDTMYDGLRKSLESIIRNYLSLTNSVVIAETTVLKGGRCVRLQSRPYSFSLDEYFRRIKGECKNSHVYGNAAGGRHAAG